MPDVMVSPKYTLDDLNNNRCTLTDVFEDQVKSCLLDFADLVLKRDHSGIAALALSGAAIQPVGAVLAGTSVSGDGEQFRRGFEYLFNCQEPEIRKRVWKCVRCGLFHEGFIKTGVVITAMSEPIHFDGKCLFVDPALFASAVRGGFDRFTGELRSDAQLQNNLQAFVSSQHHSFPDIVPPNPVPFPYATAASPSAGTLSSATSVSIVGSGAPPKALYR